MLTDRLEQLLLNTLAGLDFAGPALRVFVTVDHSFVLELRAKYLPGCEEEAIVAFLWWWRVRWPVGQILRSASSWIVTCFGETVYPALAAPAAEPTSLRSVPEGTRRGATLHGPFEEVRLYDHEGIKQWAFGCASVRVIRFHHQTGRWQVRVRLLPGGDAYFAVVRRRAFVAEMLPERFIGGTGRRQRYTRGTAGHCRRGRGGRMPRARG